jgi:hypothetical protein
MYWTANSIFHTYFDLGYPTSGLTVAELGGFAKNNFIFNLFLIWILMIYSLKFLYSNSFPSIFFRDKLENSKI